MLADSHSAYGIVAVLMHWLTAVAVAGLFALGWWMVDLGYYDPWYRKGPDLHRGVGILLAGLVCMRLCWRVIAGTPAAVATHAAWERRLATAAHVLMYLLLLAMFVSGYLISTAKGQPIDVFQMFQVPAVVAGVANLEDRAGAFHEWAAYTLIAVAGVHALAALKHHFWDRDDTLRRMRISVREH